jgi:nucleoside-diphosphate-sugar epimerase
MKGEFTMTNTCFITGFPGFLSGQIVRELLKKQINRMYLLVLPSMKDQAEKERDKILNEFDLQIDKLILIKGDITQPELGMSKEDQFILSKVVTHVWHLAAIYDLAVPEEPAYQVNVIGTQNVNFFVKTVENLERYIYFSTAYVAGEREGELFETELIKPSKFRNHYEETKFKAEVLVNNMKKDYPITIIRPGIVKGHSKTGETVKFDGPYFILNMLDHLKWLPILPLIGKGDKKVNLVPVDFLVPAVIYLGHDLKGIGRTYHITDPSPYSVKELYEAMMKELLGKLPKGKIPFSMAAFALSVPAVRRFLHVEKEALDYFQWEAHFSCKQTLEDLEGSGIVCPDFLEGLPSMIQFYNRHKEDANYQLSIR